MVKFIFVSIIFLYSKLFAVDATLEIVKQLSYIPTVSIEASNNTVISQKMHKMLAGDLKVSGHFNPSEIFEVGVLGEEPNFVTYKDKKIDLIVRFNLSESEGGLIADWKLYDVNKRENVLTKRSAIAKSDRYPFLAHKIAIDINSYLGAPTIDWMSRFVIFSKYTTPKEAEILVADYTLTYQKTIIKGGLNIFPKWASDKQDAFYYTTYLDKPTVMYVNLSTGESKKVIDSSGMIVCTDVSQNGEKILLTMAPNEQPDIYEYNLRTKKLIKATNYGGIDISGRYLEGDESIAFVSDRLGYPNVFSKNINDSGVTQLVYHGKNNNSCTTYSNYVIYTSRDRNELDESAFNLFLISTKSDYIRKLTTVGKNLFPRFSHDGESIMYIKQFQNQSALGIIRLNYNKSFLFPLSVGKLQSIDW